MIVGKAVSDGCPDEVEVGTRRVEVFLSISIGSIMMAVWVLMKDVCGCNKKRWEWRCDLLLEERKLSEERMKLMRGSSIHHQVTQQGSLVQRRVRCLDDRITFQTQGRSDWLWKQSSWSMKDPCYKWTEHCVSEDGRTTVQVGFAVVNAQKCHI